MSGNSSKVCEEGSRKVPACCFRKSRRLDKRSLDPRFLQVELIHHPDDLRIMLFCNVAYRAIATAQMPEAVQAITKRIPPGRSGKASNGIGLKIKTKNANSLQSGICLSHNR